MVINYINRTPEELRRQRLNIITPSLLGTNPQLSNLLGFTQGITDSSGIPTMDARGRRVLGTGGLSFSNPNPTITPPPTFGSRLQNTFGNLKNTLGGFVQNNQRFGDALAGAAILGGTPIADAFAVRENINPTSSASTTVGTVLDVFNQQGEFVKQISSRDSVAFNEARAKGFTVRPASDLTEKTFKKETGGALINEKTGETTLVGEKLSTARADRDKAVQARDTGIRTANRVLRTISEIEDLQRNAVSDPSTNRNPFGQLIDAAQSILPAKAEALIKSKVTSLGANNFKNIVADMKAASKSGGALGSVSETELQVFSSIDYTLSVSVTGYGKALADELNKFKEDTINGVEIGNRVAEKIWNNITNLLPSEDETTIPSPPSLNANNVDVDSSFNL